MGKFGTLKRFLLGQPPKVKEVFLIDYIDPKDNLDVYFGRTNPPVPPRPVVPSIPKDQVTVSTSTMMSSDSFLVDQESEVTWAADQLDTQPMMSVQYENTKNTPNVEECDHASDPNNVGCETRSQSTQQRNGGMPGKTNKPHATKNPVSYGGSGTGYVKPSVVYEDDDTRMILKTLVWKRYHFRYG
jgi:hypothetical protein